MSEYKGIENRHTYDDILMDLREKIHKIDIQASHIEDIKYDLQRIKDFINKQDDRINKLEKYMATSISIVGFIILLIGWIIAFFKT